MIKFQTTCETPEELAAILRAEAGRIEQKNNSLRHWVRTKLFWGGVMIGFSFACAMDLTDMHFCQGECDQSGYDLSDLIGERK